jgi:anti-anti-sigma regulatory factor
MARMLRGRGPIVVDVSGVDEIVASALLSLMQAVQDAGHAGRTLTIRGLSPVRTRTSRSAPPLPTLAGVPPRPGSGRAG